MAKRTNVKGTVYLIHMESKLAHSQHYIGWTQYLQARVAHHRNGTGSKYLAAVAASGIDFDVVRTWENEDRHFERKLKNRKNARRYCPTCTA